MQKRKWKKDCKDLRKLILQKTAEVQLKSIEESIQDKLDQNLRNIDETTTQQQQQQHQLLVELFRSGQLPLQPPQQQVVEQIEYQYKRTKIEKEIVEVHQQLASLGIFEPETAQRVTELLERRLILQNEALDVDRNRNQLPFELTRNEDQFEEAVGELLNISTLRSQALRALRETHQAALTLLRDERDTLELQLSALPGRRVPGEESSDSSNGCSPGSAPLYND